MVSPYLETAVTDRWGDEAKRSWRELCDGNLRFREGKPQNKSYTQEDLHAIAINQRPIAAVVACSDGRVTPEIFFDQSVGRLFVSRVPGNVASDGTKWMLDLAVTKLNVPLVVVLGHTRCLAVGEFVDGPQGGSGGALRFDVMLAVHRARVNQPVDLMKEALAENVKLTIEHLMRDSFPLQRAVESGLGLVGGIYDVDSGRIDLVCSI